MKAGKRFFGVLLVLTLISGTPVLDRVLSVAYTSESDARTRTLSSTLGVMPVSAASIVVNSAADDEIVDNLCTLREAIKAANSNAAYNGCAAGSGPDTITFDDDYTITLNSTQLPTIESPITITGNGAANTIIQASGCNPVTLDAGCTPATHRVFEVADNSTLTLDGVTVRHGNAISGGITNEGTLTIKDSVISGNRASSYGGGIQNLGDLTVQDSIFSGNLANEGGGGIYNQVNLEITGSTFNDNDTRYYGGGIFNANFANLTVTNSTFSGNSAGYYGGGINNLSEGTLTMTNSTFSGNQAGQDGGGIKNEGTLTMISSTFFVNTADKNGGGIYNFGTLTMTNSTLSENTATLGGGIYNWGTLTVTNSTFYKNTAEDNDNGGGINNVGTLNYKNTIIANSPSGGDCVNTGTIHTGSTHNLVMIGNCGDLPGDDPMLNLLADNGGPTHTHALLPGSPAVDAGSNAHCPDFDQRGVKRPLGKACDIGAFEVDPGLAYYFLPMIIK